MFQNWFRSALVLFAFAVVLPAQGRVALIQAVNSNPGWKAGPAEIFTATNLEKFNSDLAPSLRRYGIGGITAQNWNSPNGAVRAVLFEFMDPGDSYGFFSIRRKSGIPSSDFSIGAESFQAKNSRFFWQANYVIELQGDSRAVDALADILSKNILGLSQRPPVVSHLPPADLVAGSEEYILDASDVPSIDGLDPSLLGFNYSAEAAAADYRVGDKTVRLLLLLYPTQQLARKYAEQIAQAVPDLAASQKRIGPLLAVVSGAGNGDEVKRLLDQVHYESKVTWNEPQPGLGLGPVIVTVFTFIGILLAVCIVTGIGLGGFRVLMKTLYPHRVFDRPVDVEFIQLKLDQQLKRKEIID